MGERPILNVLKVVGITVLILFVIALVIIIVLFIFIINSKNIFKKILNK